jgi:uncharacterized protein YbjT (DUF2867 family)
VQHKVLVTGASGYIGGRLLGKLLALGHDVSALVRQPKYFAERLSGVDVMQGDLLVKESLAGLFDGIDSVYYLVHLLGASMGNFESLEEESARNFVAALHGSSVKRIIYLGGLCQARNEEMSPHMRSRLAVGEILRSSGVEVIEFRASIILGVGSFSYSLMKGLVEKLPVMVAPRWVNSRCQPIFVDDVLEYLCEALDVQVSGVFEIGGRDQTSFKGLMIAYAKIRGLKRVCLTVPFLTPKISSLWLGLITPVYARVGRKLIESVKNDSIVTENTSAFKIKTRGVEEAIRLCLKREKEEVLQTKWTDALSAKGVRKMGKIGSAQVDARQQFIKATPEMVFAILERMGGKRGWLYGNFLWKLRGIIDMLLGGVGFRRGRRHPNKMVVGDTIDFWRVEEFEKNERIVLLAEMKVPGAAWLKFELEEVEGGTVLHQTAIFLPVGIIGFCYWYFYYPFHGILFNGMLASAKRIAEKKAHSLDD